MDPYKEKLKQLVELTKSEKRGMIVFLFFVTVMLYLPDLKDEIFSDEEDLSAYLNEIRKIEKSNASIFPNAKPVTNNLKQFNPNSASIQEFTELGIPDFLANRIDKYRKAGGHFSKVKT